jgi:hypothetical protein
MSFLILIFVSSQIQALISDRYIHLNQCKCITYEQTKNYMSLADASVASCFTGLVFGSGYNISAQLQPKSSSVES